MSQVGYRASPSNTLLHGRRLLLARTAWIAVAVTTLAIVLFSVPNSFEHYRSVCTAAAEVCSERAVAQPTPEGVRALRDAGLSVGSYALLNVLPQKVRREEDPGSLLQQTARRNRSGSPGRCVGRSGRGDYATRSRLALAVSRHGRAAPACRLATTFPLERSALVSRMASPHGFAHTVPRTPEDQREGG